MESLVIKEDLMTNYLEEAKQKYKHLFGYVCTSVPLELLDAAGIMPIRLRGIEALDTSLADSVVSKYNCPYIRCVLNIALEGKFDYLSGLVVTNNCDHARRQYDIWSYKVVKDRKDFFLGYISTPHKVSDHAKKWMRDEYELFKKKLEEFVGHKITEEQIKASIKKFNAARSILWKLQELRSEEKPRLTAKEFYSASIAYTQIPIEKFLEHASDLLESAQTRKPIEKYRSRLMLAGSVIDSSQFFDIFEEYNSNVAMDELCFGVRTCDRLIDETGDPLKALSKFYFEECKCPKMMDDTFQRRLVDIKQNVEKYKLDGVVLQRIEFCDLHGIANAMLKHKLEEDYKIPVLSIDKEYLSGDIARLKTRIEAFLERIER